MKKIIVALAAAGMISFAGSANAQEAAAQEPVAAAINEVPAAQQASVYRTRSTRTVRTARRGGLLSNLIELERRKNAWLRRTFLGR